MAQNAFTDALTARLRNVARWIALMLTIVVALSACGGAGTAGGDAGEVPQVCQEARKAFSDWLNGAQDMDQAAAKMATDSAWINVELSTSRFTGDTSTKKLKGLITELNASQKIAQQKVVKAIELYEAFWPLYDDCRVLKGVKMPPACLDELSQYPAITAAQTKLARAQTASLDKTTDIRTAMIARDKRAEAAAGKQGTAATTQLNAVITNRSDTVLPKYAAAVTACNKANS